MDTEKRQGWHADPFGLHEHRYFSAGSPTKLVRDGSVESYDELPAQELPSASVPVGAGVPSGPAATTGAGQPDSGYRDPATQRRTAAAYVAVVPRKPRTGLVYTVVALVAVVAVVVFVAVGGGLSSKGRSHFGSPSANLAALVTRSAQKTLAEQTADITVSGAILANGSPVNMHGNGQVDFATNTTALKWSAHFFGITLTENEIVTSDNLYLQSAIDGRRTLFPGGRHWLQVPVAVSATQNSAQDSPDWSLQLLEQLGARVTLLGTQDIGGLTCTEYVVTPTVQAQLAVAQQEWARLGKSPSQTAAARQYLDNSTPPTLTVWFDPQRRLACQVDVYVQLTTGSAGSVSAPAADATQVLMTFTHYGVPVDITPPPPADTFSAQPDGTAFAPAG